MDCLEHPLQLFASRADGEDAVQLSRTSEWLGSRSAFDRCPHRDPGLLQRLRLESDAIDGEVWTYVVELLSRPQRKKDRECLVEHGPPLDVVGHLAESLKLATSVHAETDPDRQPPTREMIERDGLPRDLLWSATCEGNDHWSYANPCRPRSDC